MTPDVTRVLLVLLHDKQIGQILQLKSGKYRFEYDASWQRNPNAIPLSHSMPLLQKSHGTRVISDFMWGLLPDNEATLQRWGQKFNVSPRNPFALLSEIGEDCPGAVQLVKPGSDVAGRENIKWVDKANFEKRVLALMEDASAVRLEDDSGQFSLAGAQAKTALYKVNNRWGVPQGRTPTTHILKPEPKRLPGLAANEHFCLQLARLCQLPAAASEVRVVSEIPVLIVERYDRRRDSRGVQRIHQEDMCQALDVSPFKKYQHEGGPGIKEIMEILQFSHNPETDRDRFMRAQAFNFLIAGTDAHAKNYSIVYAPGGAFRLAPLYDVISNLPYAKDPIKSKLVMGISGKRELGQIKPRHWVKLANSIRYPEERLTAHIRDLIAQITGLSLIVRHRCNEEGISDGVLDALVEAIFNRSNYLSRIYGAELLPSR